MIERMIKINATTEIPADEFTFKASRSSGPGGQNVNKVNTRVTVFFDVASSANLSESQKQLILRELASRAGRDGILRAVSQKHRTQNANREAAIERLAGLMSDALKVKTVRKKSKVPFREKQKRIESKKRKSILKRLRKKPLKDSDIT
ncbi:alternative ribosome rescue aminoacyl-tRNA hydrolase ArfB [Candidatus Latescibacterota bacterium]